MKMRWVRIIIEAIYVLVPLVILFFIVDYTVEYVRGYETRRMEYLFKENTDFIRKLEMKMNQRIFYDDDTNRPTEDYRATIIFRDLLRENGVSLPHANRMAASIDFNINYGVNLNDEKFMTMMRKMAYKATAAYFQFKTDFDADTFFRWSEQHPCKVTY